MLLQVCNESEAICEAFGLGPTDDVVFLFLLLLSTALLCSLLILATTRLVYEYNTEMDIVVGSFGGG